MHGEIEFAGHVVESFGQQVDERGAEDDSQNAEHADDENQRGGDQVGKNGGFLAALLRQGLAEDGDEGGRERAFGEQVAREIGDAEAQQEGVVDEAGPEQAGHHDFAQQARDAGHGHGHGDDAGGPNHAFGRGGTLGIGCQLPP